MSLDRLESADLRLTVDPAALGFVDTSELLDLPVPWIGQARAEQAARFGLQMRQPDYHLFVLGEVGSGRSSLMRALMAREAATRPVPPDLCFLHNFEVPERPRALRLPPGEGRLLRQQMADFAKLLQTEIPKRLASPDVRAEVERLQRRSKADDDREFAALAAFAEARRFALMREEGRLVFTRQGAEGGPLTAGQAMAMTAAERIAIDADESALIGEIGRFQDAVRERERALDEALQALRRRRVKPLVERALQDIRAALRKQIKDAVKLGQYLEQVEHDVLANVELFQPGDPDDDADRLEALIEVLSRLRVNVVVDQHGCTGAPVIVEDHPQLHTLFGSIEYATENDVLVTDFTRVRAGSLVRAHGGFLMLHLRDLLADRPTWEKLRRFLRSGRVQIEEPGTAFAPIAAVSLLPEAVDVDVKIVLVASVEEYYLVQEGDPEFARRFGCKVDFADRFDATAQTRRDTAVFVAHAVHRLGLPACSAAAVAALLEASHRDAEDQARQSARFARTESLLVEAAAHAQARGAGRVDADDVRAALQARRHRHDLPEQRLQDSIRDGERLVEVSGERIGQAHGLTVVDLGDHAFGGPLRVSATTRAGDQGLLNIEREVELSGPLHDKAVLVLQGYLASLFAHLAPLALDATIVLEQEYSGVEGDSASCAEFCALLSSLSGVPLQQGLALTGAVNQRGELLPVGGVNEKIEGWFRTCETLGLDGRQGVVIPRRNRRHLMLDARIVEAVAQQRFHVHVADHVGEVMERLAGVPFGLSEGWPSRAPAAVAAGGLVRRPSSARFPPDSVLGRAACALRAFGHAVESRQARQRARARPLAPGGRHRR